ncbi:MULTISPECIES: hypothetical protein [Clostridium]|uniref:Uncharacterized protein n=2 Tax=Clostridium TaxID=1485 RepID=A0AAE6LWK8_CLOSG|nr:MULTISPECIES: hypothetical protein [Clostridium]QDY34547.1 hypothetical protein CGS26_19800 [Clostridium sporogenes]BAO05178.1 uncharacterized protein CBO05P2_153 [Clostridium botulinum B str. Osaka05]
MNIKQSIINYFIKRKKANKYDKEVQACIKLVIKIDKMGNSKILKPSEFEIDEVIKVSRNLKNYILNEFTKEDSDIKDIITNEKYNSLKNLDINTLSDCKVIASECLNIALLLQREKTPKGFFPLMGGLNTGEALFLSLLAVVIFQIIS